MIIERIAQRLSALGLSERQASLSATGSPDAIRYIRTRGAMPSAHRLQELARVLETSSAWLLGQTEDISGSVSDQVEPAEQVGSASDFSTVVDAATGPVLPRTLPIVRSERSEIKSPAEYSNIRMGLLEACTINRSEKIGWARRPPVLFGSTSAYAVYMPTVAGEPRIQSGQLFVVDPSRPARIGDTVVAYFKDKQVVDLNEPQPAYIVEYRGFIDGSHQLRQFSPFLDFHLNRAVVRELHRIMTIEDVLSV